jgi:hypothetical protein
MRPIAECIEIAPFVPDAELQGAQCWMFEPTQADLLPNLFKAVPSMLPI